MRVPPATPPPGKIREICENPTWPDVHHPIVYALRLTKISTCSPQLPPTLKVLPPTLPPIVGWSMTDLGT